MKPWPSPRSGVQTEVKIGNKKLSFLGETLGGTEKVVFLRLFLVKCAGAAPQAVLKG
jgi:hypothetical protein